MFKSACDDVSTCSHCNNANSANVASLVCGVHGDLCDERGHSRHFQYTRTTFVHKIMLLASSFSPLSRSAAKHAGLKPSWSLA